MGTYENITSPIDEKTFGKRVELLSKEADVPWNIGIIVGDIPDDNDAINILKIIKASQNTTDTLARYELSGYYIQDKHKGIERLIGSENFKKIKYSLSVKKTIRLAKYLLGE